MSFVNNPIIFNIPKVIITSIINETDSMIILFLFIRNQLSLDMGIKTISRSILKYLLTTHLYLPTIAFNHNL